MLKSLVLALAMTAAALSCTSDARAQSPQLVKFAWTPNPQTPQVDVAINAGLFKAAGLDVQVVSFPTGREALEALLGGQVDFAYMAEFPVATAVLRQQKLHIIADLSRYQGQRVTASAKAMELKSAKDLAGKKIGTTLGTNVEFFTHRLLANAGVKATIVNAGPADLVPALVRGDIDAAVMFPTFFGAAKKTLGGDYRELISTEYVLHMIVTASGAVVEKHPDVVDKFVAALVKADARIKQDPADAQKIVLGNMKGVMPLPALQEMWTEMEFQVKLDGSLTALLADEAGWIVDRGMVKAEKPPAAKFREFIVDAPLKKADPASVTLP
jgi:NitT/TauT family transport system substrate-binding protein